MKKEAELETTAVIDIDDELKKEEELLNTIKMEPILETTEIKEEDHVTKKKKMMKFTDYILLFLIILMIAVFVYVIIKIK